MRILTAIVMVSLALGAAAQSPGPITTNPIAAPIEKRGLMVEIKDLARLPDTRGLRPANQDVNPAGRARINYVRDLADGRRFVNDSRGLLYVLDQDNRPAVYANVAAVYPNGLILRWRAGSPDSPSSGVCAERIVLHDARRARDGRHRRTLHPVRIHTQGCDPPQRPHRLERDEPRCEHIRGRQA